MKRAYFLSFLCLCAALLFAFPPSLAVRSNSEPQQKPLAFIHVAVIDVTGAASAAAQADMTVVIRAGRIAELGKSKQLPPPADAQVIDASGKFLIPGLWDMHVHTWSNEVLAMYVANGITGVRDMGNPLGPILQMREAVKSGKLLGPRIVASGPIVDGPKPVWPFSIPVGSEAEGRKAVDDLKAQGVDFVKVYSLLPRAAFFGIADEAKRQGIAFAGHVPVLVSVAEASDAGQKSIEHLTGVLMNCSTREAEMRRQLTDAMAGSDPKAGYQTASRAQAKQSLETFSDEKAAVLFAKLAKNGTWQVPTLTVLRSVAYLDDENFINDPRLKYLPPYFRLSWNPKNDFRFKERTPEDWSIAKQAYQKYLVIVGAMHRAGVPILAGTDSANPYVFPGFSLHDELGLLVKAGFTPMEALQAATLSPAKYLGTTATMGTIERGKTADLVLLDADPLADISNTQKIAAVVLAGKLIERSALNEMLTRLETAAKKN